ncbi:hypothetical protein [Nonomuraea turcica]|uniref:hypothetical protein n=1 Tax=Nonomuraea sp. G32 TaxID=3067274 RepID=UPI00273C63E1|nr:hypothetical protein [Nonomuraea sp. G32]MDP4507012.1 hypothetical protein [Nonomuraea sp. G32]
MAAPKGRKLTDKEMSLILDSLSERQQRHMLAYFKGWDEEGFQNALRSMGGGE